MTAVALGFRVKSGFAIAVALGGSASAPVAIARHVVELSDPKAPDTRQPYHHGFYTHEEDARTIARRVKSVERYATRSLAALLRDGRLCECRRAGLVVGSVIDPEKVGNPHIRAHASEGRLFRTVLASALESHGIACEAIVEKRLAAKAVADLGRRDADIKKVLAAFGKSLGGPWRADKKPPPSRRGSRWQCPRASTGTTKTRKHKESRGSFSKRCCDPESDHSVVFIFFVRLRGFRGFAVAFCSWCERLGRYCRPVIRARKSVL